MHFGVLIVPLGVILVLSLGLGGGGGVGEVVFFFFPKLGSCNQRTQTHQISCSVGAHSWVMNERCTQSKNQSPATRVLMQEA